MRPFTDTTPKPLLQVQGKPLLRWHLEALARSGVGQVVVNAAWLEEQIASACKAWAGAPSVQPASLENSHEKQSEATQDAHEKLLKSEQIPGLSDIRLSAEGHDFGGALETLGGICRALPHLDEVFWLAAADVYTPDFAFPAAALARFGQSQQLAHLWLVPNPAHNPKGDFGLGPNPQGGSLALNLPQDATGTRYTYSTMGLFRKTLFAPPWCDIPPGNPAGMKAALAPLLRRAMDAGQVSAELYIGRWTDVGTPQRLAELNAQNP
jgi:N-acetyl-alpha-D-muramate 1-phosphate uridylyltransferase